MNAYTFATYSRHIGSREDHELYNWCVFLKGSREVLEGVREVEYTLHPSFPDPVRTIRDPSHSFAVLSEGWGQFSMGIRLRLKNGETLRQTYALKLDSDSWPRGEKLEQFETDEDKRVYSAVVEGEHDWRKLSMIALRSSVPESLVRSSLGRLEQQRAVRKAHFESLDNEELWGATCRVGLMPEPKDAAAGQFVEDYNYEMKLEEAAKFFPGGMPSDLVSFKIRPIENVGDFKNRFVYPIEYGRIRKLLAEFEEIERGIVTRGEATAYRLPEGSRFVFVEHESGPEIIVLLHTITAGLGAAAAGMAAINQLVKVINSIGEIINDEADNKNEGRPSDRYYGAGAISVEKRLAKGAKVIRQLKVMAQNTRKFIESAQDFVR